MRLIQFGRRTPCWILLLSLGCAQQTAIGPWEEVAKISAGNPVSGEQFGSAVALSGDGATLAVGVPMNSVSGTRLADATAFSDDVTAFSDDVTAFSSGAVYLYARSGNDWIHQAFIKASNAEQNDQFGTGVALSRDGNTLAVSSPFEDSGARGIDGDGTDNSIEQSGAVYVFSRSDGAWSEQAYIKASNTGEPEDGDTFGATMALSGDGRTLVVGAPGEDSSASGINGSPSDNSMMGAGAVYVFRFANDRWSQQAYIKSSDPQANVLFGYAVALSQDGDDLAVGAYDEDRGRGAVYVFSRGGGAWSEDVRLQASNAEPGDSMGAWVDISDDGRTVAAGAADEDSFLTGVGSPDAAGQDQATNTSAGPAYIFERTAGDWTQQAFIKASNTGREDWFGVRLALSGDGNTLAVGAPNEDSPGVGNLGDDSAQEAGVVYMYSRDNDVWTQDSELKGSNTQQFDEFGGSVSLSSDGRRLAVGGRFADSDSVSDSGGIYVFAR